MCIFTVYIFNIHPLNYIYMYIQFYTSIRIYDDDDDDNVIIFV